MPKCDFNKVPLAWVFSCKFAAYFQNTFSKEHILVAASDARYEASEVLKLLNEQKLL